MGTITFEVRDGCEYATWQTGPEKDTTSDTVEHIKKHGGPDWDRVQPAYDAWKAEQETAGKKPKGEAKDEAKATAKTEPEPDDSKPRYGRGQK